MRRRHPGLWPLLATIVASSAAAATVLDYNRDVRPILSANCFPCHGPDESTRKAKLRLDLAEHAYAQRNDVRAIVPGRLEQSEAWLRITSPHEDEVMPPPDSHRTLTAADKLALRQWIEQGAPYAPHWAFVPPRKVPPPGDAGANPIDAFIDARLVAEGLRGSPEAERPMLIRRLAFDLTGLPPSAQEVDAFVNDRAPNAYEALVDRLLGSAHFGERMALDWLDASRYADTNGYSIDGGRHMWLWRDWVIQAFNDNLPYDRFLQEQIAGDLLPGRTDAELIATGFQRNNMVTFEGGTIPEENLTNYTADRVKTLGETVLGLTLGCAQCHDHKYDPISQRDYYQLFAFFNTLSEKGLDGNGGINPAPSVQVRTVLRSTETDALRREIAALDARLARPDASILATWERREQQRLAARGRGFAFHTMKLLSVATSSNRGAGEDLRDGSRVRIPPNDRAAFDLGLELPRTHEPITGLRVVVYPSADLPGGGWGRGPAAFRRPARAADADDGSDEGTPATEGLAKGSFMLTALSFSAEAEPAQQLNLYRMRTIERVTASSWLPAHPPAACLDPRNESGWSPDLAATGPVHLTATLAEPLRSESTPFIVVQLNFGHGKSLVPASAEVFAITGTDDGTDLPPAIVAALGVPEGERTPELRARLWTHCAATAPELAPARIARANLEERLAVLTEKHPAMVYDVARKPRETFILHRGDYTQKTEKVGPGTPAVLPPMPESLPRDRAGLAAWLTQPDHPLTARVAVNRIWRLFFGAGIVATPADFGAQGEWPSHPELLDWLAVDFVESGWDVKRLVRLIVTSRTYRQSSAASADALERDPANRLLARGPRFRLPAEFIRDAALKVSGLLVPRLGGPSVHPYAPGDLWREISFYGITPATAQTYVQDHGEKLYRRSLYTYWKRSSPPASLAAFDAPSREVCTVERASTTTPAQALVLLNDPQFAEAARKLAERTLRQPGNDAARLRWAFVETISRTPRPAELEILQAGLARSRAHYGARREEATRSLAVGESPRDPALDPVELAATAQVMVTLLNLSEAITRN